MSAFFVVLLGSSGRTSPVVPVTGVSATGAVGTVSAGTELLVDVTGVFSTTSVGQAEAISSVNALSTGVSAVGEVGIALGLVESDAIVTGVSSTGSIGTTVVTGTANIVATGISAQADVGSVGTQIGGNTSFTAIGVSAHASIGNVTVSLLNNVAVNLTGVSSTASAGTLVVLASARTTLSGVSATGLLGTSIAKTSVVTTVSGVQASSSVGAIQAITQQTAAVTGVAASGQVSGVTTNVTAFVSVNATGVAATGSVSAVVARTSDSFIVLSTSSSPYVHAYEWDDSSGFGAKFANPASLPVGATYGMDITTYSGTKYLAASSSSSSGYASYIYSINGITGWGSRQNGDNNGRPGLNVKWFNDGSGNTFLATGANNASSINVNISKFTGSLVSPRTSYNWFDDGFTQLNFSVKGITYVGLTSTTGAIVGGFGAVTAGPPSTYLQGVTITESTMAFGTTWTPTSKPQGPVNEVASYDISRSSNPRAVVFAAHDSSPYISAWKVEASPLAFVRYSNPASSLPGNAEGVSYRATSSSGGQVAVAHASSPRISAYSWTTSFGFGTKYSNPVTLPTGNGQGVKFNAAGTCVAVGHATSPFVSVYPWSTGSGFGTKFSNPSTAMASSVWSIAFSN
jgi:hypothetical protein